MSVCKTQQEVIAYMEISLLQLLRNCVGASVNVLSVDVSYKLRILQTLAPWIICSLYSMADVPEFCWGIQHTEAST